MAIDYQRILMDMNRPGRRPGGAARKLGLFAVFVLFVGGGAYAAWHFGLADTALRQAGGLISRGYALVNGDNAGPAAPQEMASTVSGPSVQDSGALRPQNTRPAPTESELPSVAGPINVADAGNAFPVSVPSAPAGAASRTPPARAVQPVDLALASGSLRPAPSSASGPDMNPLPVLPDVRAQIKVVDQMLTSNPTEAMRRIEDLLRTPGLGADDAAEAGYRMGYAARMLRDEKKAEASWRGTAEKYPTLRGGRFSALALADTWFNRYAEERPQTTYWDDIQLLYSRVLGEDDAPFLADDMKAAIKARLNRLNDSVLFGTGPTKLAQYHKVGPGELLGGIANKYRVDYESIARINGINPNRIRAGMDLKVVVGEVHVIVRKNANDPGRAPTLTWFIDGRWAREYPTCVGDGNKTPAGTYTFTLKEKDPSWTNPLNGQLLPNEHPDNILGSRWMAMKGMDTQGLGVHGTTVDDSIPGYTSAGCVRLLNKDVEELFSYARIGGRVTILE